MIVKLRDIIIYVDGMVCINLIYDILVNYIFFRCITWIGCRLHSSSICDMTTYGRRPLKWKGDGGWVPMFAHREVLVGLFG